MPDSERLTRYSAARRDRAGNIAARIFRSSQRKRQTRGARLTLYRAEMRKVLPDALKDAQARGLEVTEAEIYAAADAFTEGRIARDRERDRDQAVAVRPRSTSRARESHRGRAGHRRSTSTRAGPSDDDGGPDPPPPRLRLAPKPGALYTYGALTLDPDLWAEVNR